MIKVERPAEPDVLRRKKEEWTQRLLATPSGRARTRIGRRYRHAQIKQALTRMFAGKCCYCESKILHVDWGHIEHFRPQSRFPDLTFEWSNLLLACGVCNATAFKGNQFPESGDGGPLIDPCDEEPRDHLEFRFDQKAKLAMVHGRDRRGDTTVRVLGLNRSELRAYRSKQILRLHVLAALAEEDPRAQELLDQAAWSDAEYAAFARELLHRNG